MFSRVLERLFVVVLLLSSMQVIGGLTDPEQGGSEVASSDVHMSSVIIEGGLNLFGLLLVSMRWRRVLKAARAVWPLLGLAALTTLSAMWSVAPILTLRRSVLVMVSTLLAIYLGERYSIDKLARLLAQTLCLMMLMVVAFRIVAPAYVIDAWGALKGLSAGKNNFGEYMAVAFMLLLLVRFSRFQWLGYVFLVTTLVLLWLSRSATSLLLCVLLAAAMPLWRVTRANAERRVLIYAMTAAALLLGIFFLGDKTGVVFETVGRDATLTGRTHLWSMVLPAVAKHPVLGYGYGAFWTGLKGEALDVWIGTGWLAPMADNGYLDLCLSLGLLGICVFAYVFVWSFRSSIDYLRSEQRPIGVWPVTYLCFFVLHGVSESTLLTSGSFSFLLFCIITTSAVVKRRLPVTATLVPMSRQMAA